MIFKSARYNNMVVASVLGILVSFNAVQSKIVEQTWTLKPRRAQAKDPSLSVDCNLNRLMMLVNDQYPGPTLEANVGDTIKVTLINESPTDSMALHFHGLTMRGYPYVDGTSSVTQCASPPLQTQTYEFIAQDAGTHYWKVRVSIICFYLSAFKPHILTFAVTSLSSIINR